MLVQYIRRLTLSSYIMIMLALVMAMQVFALPTRSLVRMEAANTQTVLPFLPDIKVHGTPGASDYLYTFSIYYTDVTQQQTSYIITPSGCITALAVNGRAVALKNPVGCNPRPGFYWDVYDPSIITDLSPYLHNGRNTIAVHSNRSEFDMGPIILNDNTKPAKWLGLAMILVTCIYLVVLVENHTGDWMGGAIISAGFLAYMNRAALQAASHYSMDLPGHLDYIVYVAQNWDIPKPYSGYSFFHAPLYYILQAVNVYLTNLLRSFDALTSIQLFSLACFMIFIIFSGFTLHKLMRIRCAYYLALMLLVFYPSGILFAARIDSNLLFYACYSGCLYFTLCWLQHNRSKDLGLMLVMFGLSMASRANALLLIPILCIALIYQFYKGNLTVTFRGNVAVCIGLLVTCLGLAMGPGRTEYYRLMELRHEPFLVANVRFLPYFIILEPWSYHKLLLPDLAGYVQHPLWNAFSDANGRQYFWNSMLKSSLLGEYIWQQKWLASVIGNILLLLIAYIIDGGIIHRRVLRARLEWWACLITLFIPIAGLMVNRTLNPFASSEDFRYIYPAIVSFCGLFGLVLQQHILDWRPFRKALGLLLCLVFCASAVKFYML